VRQTPAHGRGQKTANDGDAIWRTSVKNAGEVCWPSCPVTCSRKRRSKCRRRRRLVVVVIDIMMMMTTMMMITFMECILQLPTTGNFCRAMLCKRGQCHHAVSVCVCVSVTFIHSVETNKHIFKTFSSSGSHSPGSRIFLTFAAGLANNSAQMRLLEYFSAG